MSIRQSLGVGLAAIGLATSAAIPNSASPVKAVGNSTVAAAGSLPCDLYAQGNTPCVAAHSTTRALYSAFNGPLYQVTRKSDGATTNIYPLSAGGVANAAAQDSFCAGATCTITIIYDQSTQQNHISRSLGGYFKGPQADGSDDAAGAVGAPVTLNGKKAYGVFVSPGTGYRNNTARGTAVGDGPQGIYGVFDGTHSNAACCFDYGNAETSATDTGDSHMETIYFGTGSDYGTGAGNGPWILADLENGLFSQGSKSKNNNDPTQTNRFITAVVKGNSGNQWAIRGGNANTGSLSTYFNGPRPSGYNPMHKEGAIILGIGGDNSNGGQGTFYEGAMTASYPSDATENAVQANIIAAGYAAGNLNTGATVFTTGSVASIRVTTPGYTTRYLSHNGTTVLTQVVSSSSSTQLKQSASWTVRTGLGNSNCFSFESVDTPGSFVRHSFSQLHLNSNDGSKQFSEDATFCTQTGLTGSGTTSIRSWNFPARYIRHYGGLGYIASQGGPNTFDNAASYAPDVSFVVGGTSFN